SLRVAVASFMTIGGGAFWARSAEAPVTRDATMVASAANAARHVVRMQSSPVARRMLVVRNFARCRFRHLGRATRPIITVPQDNCALIRRLLRRISTAARPPDGRRRAPGFSYRSEA